LEQFARELPAGVHAVLIWDGAGFHTGEDVVVPSNVSLIQLPPYGSDPFLSAHAAIPVVVVSACLSR